MSNVVRWNPFREMAEMQRALDRMFEDSWHTGWPTANGNSLAVDVHETDTAYTAVLSLPGLNPDQINVRLNNGTLTVSGELPQAALPENGRALIQERAFGHFSRSISLPQSIDADKVEANYENGVLTLTLPKVPEAQPKIINIKTNKMLQSKN